MDTDCEGIFVGCNEFDSDGSIERTFEGWFDGFEE